MATELFLSDAKASIEIFLIAIVDRYANTRKDECIRVPRRSNVRHTECSNGDTHWKYWHVILEDSQKLFFAAFQFTIFHLLVICLLTISKVIMFHRLLTIVFACATVLDAGCSATSLSHGAERVRLTNQEPAGCEFLGDITGSEGGFWTGSLTSNSNLDTGARNDLKNRAYKMGGNVVYLLTQRAAQSGGMSHGSGGSSETSVILTGNVYRCR